METRAEARGAIETAATVLHANGQQTEDTASAVARLAHALGEPTLLIPRWGETILGFGRGEDAAVRVAAVAPTNVGINRVLAANQAIDAAVAGDAGAAETERRLRSAGTIPPLPDHVFALACAAGAAALSVTFGVAHLASLVLIFVSAGLGGYLRRALGRSGANNFAQTFAGGLLAGGIGAAGVRLGISSDLRLIAVCPCMVMVPGPYLLNGTLDLLGYRIPLGASRLGFAALTLAAISAGLLIGLSLGGTDLPSAPLGRDVPIWLVVLAAGIAASCYGVFYSMPLRLLGWPVATAMVANAVRWIAMDVLHASAVTGAAIAGFVAGLLLLPVARRHRLPFAGIGFASVVSLMPGVFVFRMVSGLFVLVGMRGGAAPPLIDAVMSDGMTAVLIVLAITVGIVVPKLGHDLLWSRHAASTAS